MQQMTLRLRNRWSYKGDYSKNKDWWNWEAFLDDDGTGELANIEYVEYILHPTFPNPVQRISKPDGGFVLRTAGWGVFIIKSFAHMLDGKTVKIRPHQLDLRYDPPVGVTD
jgi:transcription initiation factor IIF auxiliary subunit